MTTNETEIVFLISQALQWRDATTARSYLNLLWSQAKTPEARTKAHDLGNEIQKLMFEQYECKN